MSAADDYEKKYMGGEGAIARSRAMMPWWFHALLGGVAAMSIATAVASGTYVGLCTLPLLLLVWLLFLYLRVTVTGDALHVQLGVFGPKIALADITTATVAKYDVLKYGGWGIRLGLDGTVAYSVPGHGGRGLRVSFNKNGRERTVFVTSPNPEDLLSAIERARGLRVGADVRVADRTPDDVETAEPEENQEDAR